MPVAKGMARFSGPVCSKLSAAVVIIDITITINITIKQIGTKLLAIASATL